MLKINAIPVKNISIEEILQEYEKGSIIEHAEIYMKLPIEIAMQPPHPSLGAMAEAPLIDLIFRGGDTKNIGHHAQSETHVKFLLTNELNATVQSDPLSAEMLRKWLDAYLPQGAKVSTRSGYNEL